MNGPVRVITVEREYGSRGGEFAHELARRLGWRLLDAELVKSAAAAAGVDPETAARFDERLDPWYYRYGKAFWHDSGYPAGTLGEEQIFDSQRMAELIRREIETAARIGECVLVGRGAACALACVPGCFHVFVYATAKAKRTWFSTAFPGQAAQADQLLAAYDKRRAAFIRMHYQQDWCARGHYHLLLNSSLGLHGMIEATLAAAALGEYAEDAAGTVGAAGANC